jgi:hypothetical protein
LGEPTCTQCGCGGHRVKKGTTGKFIDRHMIGCVFVPAPGNEPGDL